LPLIDGAATSRSTPSRATASTKLAALLVVGVVVLVAARAPFTAPEGGHAHLFLAKELVSIGLAGVATAAAMRANVGLARDRIGHLLLALVSFALVSTIAAKNPYAGLRATTLGLGAALLFAVARSVARDPNARAVLLEGLSFPVALVALSVVAESLGVSTFSRAKHAPGGFLGERNVAAELLVLALPVLTRSLRTTLDRTRFALHTFVLVSSTSALVLTRTRSAWLAAMLVVLVETVLALRASGPPHRRALPALALLLGALVGFVLPTRLDWTSAHPYADTFRALADPMSPSGAGRLVQVATTLRMGFAHPLLGVGPGNWSGAYLGFARPDDPTVHEGAFAVNRLANGDISALFAEQGVIGIVLVGALAVTVLRSKTGTHAERRARATLVGALAVVAALDAVLTTPAALVFVAVAVGACTPDDSSERSPETFVHIAIVVCGLASLLATARLGSAALAARATSADARRTALSFDPGEMDGRLLLADELVQNGRCEDALREIHVVRARTHASPMAAELEALGLAHVDGARPR
jgi:hypothetical protein